MKRLFLIAMIVTAQAQSTEPKVPASAIAAVVRDYANSIGCEVHVGRNDITPLTIDYRDVYVVRYSLDLGCSGGSAMQRSAFAVVGRTDYGRKLYVLPNYSAPHQTTMDFPANVHRIFMKDGQLRFQAKDLTDGDSLCCPSLPIEGSVIFREGKWVNGDKK
jgi:hypothetical protein